MSLYNNIIMNLFCVQFVLPSQFVKILSCRFVCSAVVLKRVLKRYKVQRFLVEWPFCSFPILLHKNLSTNLQASDDKETSLDKIGSYMATSARPADSFLFISRNIVQRRHNLQKLQGNFSFITLYPTFLIECYTM